MGDDRLAHPDGWRWRRSRPTRASLEASVPPVPTRFSPPPIGRNPVRTPVSPFAERPHPPTNRFADLRAEILELIDDAERKADQRERKGAARAAEPKAPAPTPSQPPTA